MYYDWLMALFLAIAPEQTAFSSYGEIIAREFAGNFIAIGQNCWAISAPGIAKDVAVRIHGENPVPGSATIIVVAVSGYWGIAANPVWEWFASQLNVTHALK
jgi:hypothetical protein